MQKKHSLIFLVLTTISSFLIGSVAAIQWRKHHKVNPQAILAKVRDSFYGEEPIEGAWIESKSSSFNRFGVTEEVYYGGLTRHEDHELIQYEFIADAFTGTVIDIYRL